MSPAPVTAGNLRVTGAWAQLLSDWLDSQHLPAPGLRARLDSLRPTDPLAMHHWQFLLTRAAELKPGEAVGLAIGAQVKPRHVGPLGYLVLTCHTLGQAMQAYQRYESLFYGTRLVETVFDATTASLTWPAAATTRELADSVSIAALVTFLRRLLDAPGRTPPAPIRVEFAFDRPAITNSQTTYDAFFSCPVRFGAPHTAVHFPLEYLGLVLPHNDTTLRAVLERQAQALLNSLPGADDFERALQQTIARLLPDGKAQLAPVAAQLHLSVRSLQRRLTQRKTSWQQLLNTTRQSLAELYLADVSLGLRDIGLLLGFSEQSAFTRACKQWTGQSPGQWRRQINARDSRQVAAP